MTIKDTSARHCPYKYNEITSRSRSGYVHVHIGWSVYGSSIGKMNNSQRGKRLNVLYIHVHVYYTLVLHISMLHACINTCCYLPGPNQRKHFEKQTMCAGIR